MVTGLLLMPVVMMLAFLLPGVKFIPLGDLANIVYAVVMITAATGGNIVRSFIISIPVFVGKLYIASNMSVFLTNMGRSVGYKLQGYNGDFTSLLEGGNIFRFWILRMFQGRLWALLFIPVVILLLVLCRNNAAN
jgi:PTS system galactitol-specific IIC component